MNTTSPTWCNECGVQVGIGLALSYEHGGYFYCIECHEEYIKENR